LLFSWCVYGTREGRREESGICRISVFTWFGGRGRMNRGVEILGKNINRKK
jgi:hypothetical protein